MLPFNFLPLGNFTLVETHTHETERQLYIRGRKQYAVSEKKMSAKVVGRYFWTVLKIQSMFFSPSVNGMIMKNEVKMISSALP